MALITINTPFNIDLEFSLAAFYKRMFAWLIDLVVIFIYCYIMWFFLRDVFLDEKSAYDEGVMNAVFAYKIFVIFLPVYLYHCLFELFMGGRSPGKFFLGIKVVNKEGAALTFSQILIRLIVYFPNYFLIYVVNIVEPQYFIVVAFILGVTSLPDVICVAVTKHSQRLGDLAAGTVVIDTKYKMDIHETIFMDLQGQTYVPVFPEVLKLTDRDINGIRNLLAGKLNSDTENYMMRVAYRIEEVLNIKMNGDPVFFLQTLLKDYNYLTQNR